MRPFFAFCAVALIAVSSFGQNMGSGHHPFGSGYGYGSDAPLITTPMLSFETVTENPVGATNATTGLEAGATNATVSQLLSGSTSSNYTVGVWYQGGSPVITPQVNTWPIPREGYGMHAPMMGHEMGDEQAMEREHMARHEKAAWTYFSGPEYTTPVASAAKGPGPGKHVYTNDDVTRQNNNNGNVKYDGKTEKIQ